MVSTVKMGKFKPSAFLILTILLITIVLLPEVTQALKPEVERPFHEKAIPGSFIVYVDPGFDKGPVKHFIKSKGAVVAHDYMSIPAIGIKGLPEAALEGLKNIPGITRIWQDRAVNAYLTESIPQISATDYDINAYGYGIKVCILDTGIDNNHPAFGSRIIAQRDFVNNDENAQDDDGHGTHVAGILASEDSKYRGVARGAYLIAGKVLDESGSGSFSDVIAGIEWCAYTVDADIINMSLGGGKFSSDCDGDPAAQASNTAVTNGVIVVAASGNDGWDNAMGTPACGSKVIAVGGVYDNTWVSGIGWGCTGSACLCVDIPAFYDTRFCASNGGPQLDIVAPGALITSARLGGGLVTYGGTSMATPHVSGLAALALEKGESLEPIEVRTLIRSNSIDKGTLGFDYIYGYGRIDAKETWDNTPDQTAFCGNDDEEVGEECDGTDLGGATCGTLGYDTGDLECAADCSYEMSVCQSQQGCGDGYCAGQTYGEDCTTCPADCPKKTVGKPSKRWCCGDGICSDGGETADICPVDCGGCTTNEDCNDNNICTTDECNSGVCQNIWPVCGLEDGCCGPDCSTTDPDCDRCAEFKQPCATDTDCCAGLTCHPRRNYCK